MHAPRQENQARNLALFDFDGTLCPSDSFTGFIFYALSAPHIIKQGIKILPWIQAYYLKLYPAHKMRPKLFNAMFRHMPADTLKQLAHDYVQQLKQKLDPVLLQQLKQHQANGDRVVLVSASIDLYLIPLCQELGIELICTETETQQGIFTGQYQTADCSRMEKKRRILQYYPLADYQHVYAYGNSHEDLDMLSLAHSPYMVGQDTQLPQLTAVKKPA